MMTHIIIIVNVEHDKAMLKCIAHQLPFSWRKNFATVPALRRGTPTMQVGSFDSELLEVVTELTRFCRPGQFRVDHAFFGRMSFEDWLRWGYLHTDHHLRQFGR